LAIICGILYITRSQIMADTYYFLSIAIQAFLKLSEVETLILNSAQQY
jgi:hypothetical protein